MELDFARRAPMKTQEIVVAEVINHHHNCQDDKDDEGNVKADAPFAVGREAGFGMRVSRHSISSGGSQQSARSGTKRTRSGSDTTPRSEYPRPRGRNHAFVRKGRTR